jgi:hypothetical protein
MFKPNSIVRKTILTGCLAGTLLTNIASSAIAPATAQAPAKLDRAAPSMGAMKVQLIDAGAEPRREMKFVPTPNSKQTLTLEMGMGIDMAIDGQKIAMPTKLTKMVMKMDLTVTKVEPNGNIHYNFAYADARFVPDASTPKEMTEAMQESLKKVVGIKGNAISNNRGKQIAFKMVLPENMEPSTKQLLNQLDNSFKDISTPLPQEAVGTGAKWKTTLPLNVLGMKLNQTMDYEVIAIDAESATIKAKFSQSAQPQNMQLPNAPKGAKVRLNSFAANGEGKITLRFNSMLPVQGKTSILSNSDISVRENAKDKAVNMKSKTSIDLNMSSN